jgi:hypothetical protein
MERLIEDMKDLRDDIKKLAAEVHKMREEMARIAQKLDDRPCIAHDGRLMRIESLVGKQNFVAAVIGALAAGIILAAKYFLMKIEGGG